MGPRSERWLTATSSALRRNGPDLAIVAALLVLFAVVHRFVESVEIGGDAISKWHFVRQWSYKNEFAHAKWDHHHARMGVNVVTYAFQKVLGRQWWVYHLPPFFMTAAWVPLVYALGRRLAGRPTAVLAALFVTYMSAVHRNASQLLPDGFAGTYAVLTVYAFARFVEAAGERARTRWLVIASLLAFAGYEAKETFFFFYPGLVIALWLSRRRFSDVTILCGVLLAGLALETLAYRLFTDYSSRLAIVRGTHLEGLEEEPMTLAASGFIRAFARLEPDWYALMALGLLGAIWLLFFNRSSRAIGRAIALFGLCHLLSFSVSSQLFQAPRPRYLDPAIPFVALAAAEVFGVALTRALAWQTLQRLPAGRRLAQLQPRSVAAWLAPSLLGVALFTLRAQAEQPPFSGWAQGRRLAELASNTYDRNLPIAAPTGSRKTLPTIYQVYLDDRKLARGKLLPNFEDVVQRTQQRTFLVKNPNAYRGSAFQNLLRAGCVLELRRSTAPVTKRGYADTTLIEPLPARCDKLVRALGRRHRS